MRIGTYKRVGKINSIPLKYALRQIFKIHLMHDPDPRRHDTKTIERLSSPLQESISLSVATKLHLHVSLISRLASGEIDLHRMIDNEIHGYKRLDQPRVLAHLLYRGT